MKQYKNEKEYAVFAMRRSGHHAIMEWILANTEGIHCFLNDCDLDGNPYNTYKGGRQEQVDVNSTEDPGVRKSLLMYNFEDMYFKNFSYDVLEDNHDDWLGKTKKFNTLVVIRDPFNLLASKFKWYWGQNRKEWKPSLAEFKDTPNLWVAYADEFIGNTNILRNKIVIDFNRWFSDENYKRELANILGLNSYHKGIKKVAKYGANTWGDSFDNLKYEGKANEMKVLERWQSYLEDKEYIEMINNPKLLELSEKIYPGITKKFLKCI